MSMDGNEVLARLLLYMEESTEENAAAEKCCVLYFKVYCEDISIFNSLFDRIMELVVKIELMVMGIDKK